MLRQFNKIHNDDQVKVLIEDVYARIVAVLMHSSRCTVPMVKVNVMKFWWDEELSHLKKESMSTNIIWIQSGKPRSGPVFENYKNAKYKYKLMIRDKQCTEKEEFTNDLHDSLIKKD